MSLNALKHFTKGYVCVLWHIFSDLPSSQNSALVFTFCLHRASGSIKDERSETSQIFLGHTYSLAYVRSLLDSQNYFKVFQSLFWPFHYPAFPFKIFVQLLVDHNCYHHFRQLQNFKITTDCLQQMLQGKRCSQ